MNGYMKRHSIQYMLLLSLHVLYTAKGTESQRLQSEALVIRKICFTSKATALGTLLMAPLASDAFIKKTALVVGGLASLGAIASYYRLSRLLPAHARSFQSISCYIITGIWPSQARSTSPQQCSCHNVPVKSVFCSGSITITSDSKGTYVNGVRMHHSYCHLYGNGSSSSSQDNTVVERTLDNIMPRGKGTLHTLIAHTPASIIVKKGSRDSVTIRAPRSLLEQLQEEYANGVLTLTTKGRAFSTNGAEITYQVQVENLNRFHTIRQRGIGNLTLPAIGSNAVDIDIEASGSGDLTVQGDIAGKNVSIRQSGIGNCRINGSIQAFAGEVALEASGSGNILCRNVTSKDALRLTLSSIGSITLNNVNSTFSTLNLTLEGSGDFSAQRCGAKDKAIIRQSSIGKLTLAALEASSIYFTQSGSGGMSAGSFSSKDTITLAKTSIGKARITDSLSCRALTIEQSGSGDTTCQGVSTDTLEIDNSSIGNVTLSGTCAAGGTVTNTGSGDCCLAQLRTTTPLRVRSSGIGRVNTW